MDLRHRARFARLGRIILVLWLFAKGKDLFYDIPTFFNTELSYRSILTKYIDLERRQLEKDANTSFICNYPPKWIIIIHVDKISWVDLQDLIYDLNYVHYPTDLERHIELQLWIQSVWLELHLNDELGRSAKIDQKIKFVRQSISWSHGHKSIRLSGLLLSSSGLAPLPRFSSPSASPWVDFYVPSSVANQARTHFCNRFHPAAQSQMLGKHSLIFLKENVHVNPYMFAWMQQAVERSSAATRKRYGTTIAAATADTFHAPTIPYGKPCSLHLDHDWPNRSTSHPLAAYAVRFPGFGKPLDSTLDLWEFPILSTAKDPVVHQEILSFGVDAHVWDAFHRFYHILRSCESWWYSRHLASFELIFKYLRDPTLQSHDLVLPLPISGSVWLSFWYLFLKRTGTYMIYPYFEAGFDNEPSWNLISVKKESRLVSRLGDQNLSVAIRAALDEQHIRFLTLDNREDMQMMCSEPKTDHTKVFGLGEEPSGFIAQVMEYGRQQNSTLIAVGFCTRSYHEMLMSWYCNVNTFSIKPKAVVVFVYEADYAEFLKGMNLDLLVVDISRELSEMSSDQSRDAMMKRKIDIRYGTELYWHFMLLRSSVVSRVVNSGWDLLLFDLDQAWMGDPLKYIDSLLKEKQGNCDLFGAFGSRKEIGGNFLYFRSTFQTRWLTREVLSEFALEIHRVYKYFGSRAEMHDGDTKLAFLLNRTNLVGHRYKDRFASIDNDQSLTSDLVLHSRNRLLEDKVWTRLAGMSRTPLRWLLDVQFCALPREVVVDGTWYNKKKPPIPMIINNNYIIGLDKKITRAKRENLWFWDAIRNRCLGNQQLSRKK